MNRLRELRELRDMTQAELGDRVGLSQQQIGNLERDDRRMTFTYARQLAPALQCDPSDLMPHAGLSIPVALAVAAAEAEGRPDVFDLPEPKAHVQSPRRLAHPEDTFAAEVLDDSADLLYPPGSTLILRRIDSLPEKMPLTIGDKIVVRSFLGERGDGRTHEVLAGYLDRSITGDLMLVTRSHNRRVPSSVVVQRSGPSRGAGGLTERVTLYRLAQERTITYAPSADDPAEIVGRIEYAITPQ
jgi:transcriptional regulator with XRE-family HTH domain